MFFIDRRSWSEVMTSSVFVSRDWLCDSKLVLLLWPDASCVLYMWDWFGFNSLQWRRSLGQYNLQWERHPVPGGGQRVSTWVILYTTCCRIQLDTYITLSWRVTWSLGVSDHVMMKSWSPREALVQWKLSGVLSQARQFLQVSRAWTFSGGGPWTVFLVSARII